MKYAVLVKTIDNISDVVVEKVEETMESSKYKIGSQVLYIPDKHIANTESDAKSIRSRIRLELGKDFPVHFISNFYVEEYSQIDLYLRFKSQAEKNEDLEDPMVVEDDEDKTKQKKSSWDRIFLRYPEMADAIIDILDQLGNNSATVRARKDDGGKTTYIAFKTPYYRYTISASCSEIVDTSDK